MKKNSGKMIEGKKNAGLVTKLWIVRQATACVTSRKRLMSAPASSAGRRRASVIATRRDRGREPEPERQRLAVPARDDQRADALDQVGDRVVGRDRAEPVLLDQRCRGRLIELRNSSTNSSGKKPWTASPEPERSPM